MTGPPPVPPQAAAVPYDPMTEPEGFRAYKAGRAAGAAAERERIRAGAEGYVPGDGFLRIPADLLDGTAGEPGGDTP